MSIHITKKVTQSTPRYFVHRLLALSTISMLLAACGGGSENGGHSHIKQKLNPAKNTDVSDSVNTTSQPNNTNNTQVSNSQTLSPVASIPKPNIHMTQSELAVYNRLNMRRMSCGFGSLQSNTQLHNAAANHVNYLLYMNKHSEHGFQGHHEFKVDSYSGISNPYFTGYKLEERIKNSGRIGSKAVPVNYAYQAAGENLSFLTFNAPYLNSNNDDSIALSSVNSLLAAPYHMASMLSPYFTQVGISYGREKIKNDENYFGSILELVLATPKGTRVNKPSEVLNYPCDGTTDTQYELTHESPNPFGSHGRNLRDNPIGQPIYIFGTGDIKVTDYKMTDAAGKQIALKALTHTSDPNRLLTNSQVILLPLTDLKPSQAYRVSYQVSVDGGAKQTKTLVFHTKAKS